MGAGVLLTVSDLTADNCGSVVKCCSITENLHCFSCCVNFGEKGTAGQLYWNLRCLFLRTLNQTLVLPSSVFFFGFWPIFDRDWVKEISAIQARVVLSMSSKLWQEGGREMHRTEKFARKKKWTCLVLLASCYEYLQNSKETSKAKIDSPYHQNFIKTTPKIVNSCQTNYQTMLKSSGYINQTTIFSLQLKSYSGGPIGVLKTNYRREPLLEYASGHANVQEDSTKNWVPRDEFNSEDVTKVLLFLAMKILMYNEVLIWNIKYQILNEF